MTGGLLGLRKTPGLRRYGVRSPAYSATESNVEAAICYINTRATRENRFMKQEIGVTVTLLLKSALLLGSAFLGSASAAELSEEEAFKLGKEAYIYGYPLVTMEMTRRVMTNVSAIEGLRGPMGQFVSAREYLSAAFKDVTAPNADTLYSAAWLDVGK
jgi:hypothetical protein